MHRYVVIYHLCLSVCVCGTCLYLTILTTCRYMKAYERRCSYVFAHVCICMICVHVNVCVYGICKDGVYIYIYIVCVCLYVRYRMFACMLV